MTNKYSTQINQLGASLGVIALSIGQLSQQIAEANFNLLKLATDINDAETTVVKIEIDASQITDALDGILNQLGVVKVVLDDSIVDQDGVTDVTSEVNNFDIVLAILTQRIDAASKEVHLGVFGADERLKRDQKLADDVQEGVITANDLLAYLTRGKTWADLYGQADPNSGEALGDGDDDISAVVEKPVEPKVSEVDAQAMEVLEGRRERPVPEELKDSGVSLGDILGAALKRQEEIDAADEKAADDLTERYMDQDRAEEVGLIDPEVAVADASFPGAVPEAIQSDDFASALAAAELAETVAEAVVAAPAPEGVDYSIGGGFYHNKLTEVDAAGLLQFAHKHYGTKSFSADALFQISYNRGQKKVRDDAGFRVTGRGPVFVANLIDFLDALAGNTFKASIGDNPTDARKLTLVKDGAYSYQIIDGGNL